MSSLSIRKRRRGSYRQFFLLKYLLNLINDGKRLEDIIKEQAVLARKGNVSITESENMIIFEFDAYLNNLNKVVKEELQEQAKALATRRK